jgi:hypothetical protein
MSHSYSPATLEPSEQAEVENAVRDPQLLLNTTHKADFVGIGAFPRRFHPWYTPLTTLRQKVEREALALGGFLERKELGQKRKLEDSLEDARERECSDRLAIFDGRDEQDLLAVQAPPSKKQRTRMEEICHILCIGEEGSEESDRDSQEVEEGRGLNRSPEGVLQTSALIG